MTTTLTSHRRTLTALACLVGVVAVLLPARADANHREPRAPRRPRPPVVNQLLPGIQTPGGITIPGITIPGIPAPGNIDIPGIPAPGNVVIPGTGGLTPGFLGQPGANVDAPPGFNTQQIVIPPFDFGAALAGLPLFFAQLIQRIIAQIRAIIARVNANLCASFGGTFCASP